MKIVKVLSVGLISLALVVGIFAFGIKNASAQNPTGISDSIASWIVLDGLFNPGYRGMNGNWYGYGLGGNNIASWIVLDGLFNPR